MSYQDFCFILKKIPNSVVLHFSGFSEPFLNPEASKMMKTAYDKGYTVQIFTTLAALRQSDVNKIKDIKFQKFMVHIPDSKYFRYNTEKWLEKYALIASAGIKPQFMTMGEIDQKIAKIVGKCKPSRMFSRAGTVDHIHVQRKSGRLICPKFSQRGNVLLPNGDVYLCCMDFSLQHKLGNLLTGKYEDLFTGAEYKRILEALNSDNGEVICRYCEKAKII